MSRAKDQVRQETWASPSSTSTKSRWPNPVLTPTLPTPIFAPPTAPYSMSTSRRENLFRGALLIGYGARLGQFRAAGVVSVCADLEQGSGVALRGLSISPQLGRPGGPVQ
jgi:hypothetical protein